MNRPLKVHLMGIVLLFFMGMIVVVGINNTFSVSEVSASTNPTYTIFIHGVDTNGGTKSYQNWWEQNKCGGYYLSCGIPGYVYDHTPSKNYVCVVEYYGTPWMRCNGIKFTLSGTLSSTTTLSSTSYSTLTTDSASSIDNGTIITLSSTINGTSTTGSSGSTIGHLAHGVWYLLRDLANYRGSINVDLVGYSMGGLISYYMMQTWGEPSGVTLKSIFTLDSPLLGSAAANFIVDEAITDPGDCNLVALALTGLSQTCTSIASEPQIQQMEVGSSFVNNLNNAVKNSPRYSVEHAYKWFFDGSADTNPTANKMAAWYIPVDALVFGSHANDGLVSVWSETYNYYLNDYVTYDAVHTPTIGGSGYSSPSTGTAILQNYYVMQNIAYQISNHQ